MLRWLISKLITNLLTISIKVCIRLDIFNIKKMSQKSKTTCRNVAEVNISDIWQELSTQRAVRIVQYFWFHRAFGASAVLYPMLCGNCSRKVQPSQHTPYEQNATNHCLLRIPRIPTDHFCHELSSSRMNSPCRSFPSATCTTLTKRDLKTRFRRCDEWRWSLTLSWIFEGNKIQVLTIQRKDKWLYNLI